MGTQFPDDVFIGGVLRAVQQVSGAFFTFGGPGSEFSLVGGVPGIFLGILDPTVSPGFQAGRGSLYLKASTTQGVYQKTGIPPTAWTLVGGGGGGDDPSAAASDLIDFYTPEGASDASSGPTGSSQIVTGTTIGGVPMLGVEQLAVEAAGDDAIVALGEPIADAKAIIDEQGSAGVLVTSIQLHTTDPQTDPVNQTTLELGTSLDGIFPKFSASNAQHGNNHWWVLTNGGEGFVDTGVAVDTTKPHLFTIKLDPAAPLTTFAIDGAIVHTVAFVDSSRPFKPWVHVTSDNAAGTNVVSVDWIQWTATVVRTP